MNSCLETRSSSASPFADNPPFSRRQFIRNSFFASAAMVAARDISAQDTNKPAPLRKMKICLSPGAIGVQAFQPELINHAAKYGFEAVEPFAGYLSMEKLAHIEPTLKTLAEKRLVWGASPLSVDFRQGDNLFNQGVQGLPRLLKALQAAGANRIGTWISPSHPNLTYNQNFKRHVERLRIVASKLKEYDLRLGLEYVGTHTLLVRSKYPFIHTLAETRELIEAIGTGNVGLVLDSWHWWQAGDSTDEILKLKNEDIISVDLNDAPVGIAKDQQQDGQRELPLATGVIPVEPFLKALVEIGYDGPVRAEPFNKPLNDLANEPALEATSAAMKKAMALLNPK